MTLKHTRYLRNTWFRKWVSLWRYRFLKNRSDEMLPWTILGAGEMRGLDIVHLSGNISVDMS
jgi:hypothetical protein